MWDNEKLAPGRLIIVNLQKTPFDKHCYLRVFSKTDQFMSLVMKFIYGEQFDLNEYTKQQNEKIEKMTVENSNFSEISNDNQKTFTVSIGGEEGKTEWLLWGGRRNSEVLKGTLIQFKIKDKKIYGGNVQNDYSSIVRKDYSGSYDPETKQLEITVTYSFGQIASYSGILSENGQETRLKFQITKAADEEGNALVGDHGFVVGKTSLIAN